MSRVAVALAAGAALSGFTFVRHHITEAPVVDTTVPFYGAGLVIGPEEKLPGVAKRVPLKLRVYKFLQRKGDTQYVPGLRREADCSLTAVWSDLADYTIARTEPRFADRLRSAAGLPGIAGPFTGGCVDAALGTASRRLAGGRLANGYQGAGPDFHSDGSIVIYRADAQHVLDHHDIVLADGPNQFVGALATADFNGDGNDDYAVDIGAYGDDAVGRIAILLGDGTGNFGAPSYLIAATAAPGSGQSIAIVGMTVADFDHDAKLDIVTSASVGGGSHGDIVFFKGRGDGTFASPATIASEVVGDLVAADLDGDDELDLACGDGHVLFGNGAGGFDPAPDARFDDGRLAAADFDNDGHVDLAIVGQTGDGSLIHLWRGDGAGRFARIEPGYGTGYGTGSADVLVADLDGDGNADLVVGAAGDGLYGPSINSQGQTQFLLGRGDGTFASPPAYEKAIPTVADFDRDGKPDLIAFDTNDGGDAGVRVLVGDGQGFFAPGPFSALGFGSVGSKAPFVAADLDADGKIDLVALEHWDTSSARAHTRLGNGDATFHATGPDLEIPFDVQTTGAGLAAQPAVADLDGNGTPDLALVGIASGHGALYLLPGNGDGTFGAPRTLDATLAFDGYAPSRVVASDLDRDGKRDLVLEDGGAPFASTPAPGGIRVYRNLGGGNFAAPNTLAGPSYPDGVDVGDVDGDGKTDIVATGTPGGNTLYVYEGNGDATFASADTTTLPDIWYRSVLISDIDGDGKADLMLGNCCGLTFGAFARGDGSGHFASPAILPLVVSPTALLLADLDGNGRPDLLMHGGSSYDDMRVFMNTWKDAIFASGFDG